MRDRGRTGGGVIGVFIQVVCSFLMELLAGNHAILKANPAPWDLLFRGVAPILIIAIVIVPVVRSSQISSIAAAVLASCATGIWFAVLGLPLVYGGVF